MTKELSAGIGAKVATVLDILRNSEILANGATPGPWLVEHRDTQVTIGLAESDGGVTGARGAEYMNLGGYAGRPGTAEFIVDSRRCAQPAYRALIIAIERLAEAGDEEALNSVMAPFFEK